MAETVQIPGPLGPLEAELVAVPQAQDIVVIVPGSGPTNRDGNSPGGWLQSDTYRLLAEGLADRGIASLRIDKRGMFGSAGAIENANNVTVEDYASDVSAWVERAAEDAPCVWIAGHSEGGLVALVAALDPPEPLCGLILIATPGRLLGQVLIDQLEANPANGALMPELRGVVADLEAGRPRDPEALSEQIRPLFASGLQRFMMDLFSYDPAALSAAWPGPALVVQGDADSQIGMADAEALAAASPQRRTLRLEDGTHMLKVDVPGDRYATYTTRDLPLHPDLLDGLVAFITADR